MSVFKSNIARDHPQTLATLFDLLLLEGDKVMQNDTLMQLKDEDLLQLIKHIPRGLLFDETGLLEVYCPNNHRMQYVRVPYGKYKAVSCDGCGSDQADEFVFHCGIACCSE